MYHHVKQLMYTVRVGEPDPKFGNMLLEQFGGANGELAAAMQYSVQGLNTDDPEMKDILMDIGTESSAISRSSARWRASEAVEDRSQGAEADPLVSITGGGGVNLLQLRRQRLDGRLSEDHRSARGRSAQQHRRRGAREDHLRAPDWRSRTIRRRRTRCSS